MQAGTVIFEAFLLGTWSIPQWSIPAAVIYRGERGGEAQHSLRLNEIFSCRDPAAAMPLSLSFRHSEQAG